MPTVNLDTSSRLDIVCRRGDTFDLTVDFNTSLSSYAATTWELQVRDSDTNNDTADDSPHITVSGESNVLTTTGFHVSGEELRIIINDSDMNVASGVFVYDLQTTGSGTKTWLHGIFKIVEDVTI